MTCDKKLPSLVLSSIQNTHVCFTNKNTWKLRYSKVNTIFSVVYISTQSRYLGQLSACFFILLDLFVFFKPFASYLFLSSYTKLVLMAYRSANPLKIGKGNPLPKRGQIKAQIFSSLVDSLIEIVFKARNRGAKKIEQLVVRSLTCPRSSLGAHKSKVHHSALD